MYVALLLLLVAIGSVLFHLWGPWWWTPIATNWSYIDDTINITFWITGFAFVAVIAFKAPRKRGFWRSFLFVAICRLSLFVEN